MRDFASIDFETANNEHGLTRQECNLPVPSMHTNPCRSAFLRPLRGTSATLRDVERPLATKGTQESVAHFLYLHWDLKKTYVFLVLSKSLKQGRLYNANILSCCKER